MAGETADPPLSDRQEEILRRVEARGFVTVDALAEAFGVSAQTVRRDIIALDAAGLLQRFHGGAGPGTGARGDPAHDGDEAFRLAHGRKRMLEVESKRIIAARVAEMVPDGAALFLDVGTTVEAAAAALNARSGLQVFTNSMRAALRLDPSRHAVRVLGGQVSGTDGSLAGAEVVEMIARLDLDWALLGCSAVSEGPLGARAMDFDIGKIAVKRAAMAAAHRTALLIARAKFDRRGRVEIAPLSAFDRVLTEVKMPFGSVPECGPAQKDRVRP
ncbi:MAG: DeoR/GlpR family DNA-binding transcription regulator [Paracoccaceae bacterium]|jgi:DeoR family glycerol-3-phosphate regulon repressor|nr:DeoR/GlpR family DNA-binding transcription regulator [Paracoccaceae bacterium]